MSRKHTTAPKSKRQTRREMRQQQIRRRRLMVIGGIILVSLVIIGLVAIPTILQNNAPVGDFTTITPHEYNSKDGMAIGDPNAPVKIEIFEDFKCPACKGYTESIEPQVIANLVDTGQVYYVFHNYPFETRESDDAANAAACAAEQNMFWEYHQMVFANMNGVQGELSINRLKAFAEALGLDTSTFNACFDENRYQADIDASLDLGREYKVTGTPSVFVNGVIITPGYVPDFENILAAVEEALTGN